LIVEPLGVRFESFQRKDGDSDRPAGLNEVLVWLTILPML